MQNRVNSLLSYFDVVIQHKLYIWLVSNSMRLKNMNENYFRLKTLAISRQQEQKQQKTKSRKWCCHFSEGKRKCEEKWHNKTRFKIRKWCFLKMPKMTEKERAEERNQSASELNVSVLFIRFLFLSRCWCIGANTRE